jgi:hypothetical protein
MKANLKKILNVEEVGGIFLMEIKFRLIFLMER